MKCWKYMMTAVLVALSIMACKEKKDTNRPVLAIQTESEEVDTTAYGKCYGAAMNSLMLITDSGDTIAYMLQTDDERADVQGGLFEGDKLAILANEVEGTMRATKVINLTTLLGKWTNVAKNFDIKDGGVVESHVSAETKPYTSWKIFNGKLILSSDTFDVVNLGPDSLYLENKEGIFAFKRQQ